VRKLEADALSRGWGRAAAIGVAVPGPLDLIKGIVMAAPHVAAWRSFPLRARLERELGRDVVLENDANAWALGEFWRGAARGRRNVVLLTLGTGVGGGLIVDGRLVHGRSGMAGELGHVTVEADGPPCDCGARGCLEAYASASGLQRLIESRRSRGKTDRMPAEFIDQTGSFSVRRLAAAARRDNALAKELFSVAGGHLGIAIASFINIFNPEMVVLGGGVSGALFWMKAEMMREIRARAIGFAFRSTKIVRAALGERAGIVGAAYAAMEPASGARLAYP
jgi:glucokinase